jgi:hypothetical protein
VVYHPSYVRLTEVEVECPELLLATMVVDPVVEQPLPYF